MKFNPEMKVSADMQQLAEQALASGQVLKETDAFSIHSLPEGFMDHFVLLLWQPGQDFPPERRPLDFEMPVTVDGRSGYLIEESEALKYA